MQKKDFEHMLGELLPQIDHKMSKIVLAQVVLALKLEGVIGRDLTEKECKMVHLIKDAVLKSPEAREEAIRLADKLLVSSEGDKK